MEQVTLTDFREQAKAQGVPREHLACKCPICGTIQSMQDFVDAGLDMEAASNKFGFSCIGRVLGSGPAKNKKPAEGKTGCDWTLGGLFRLHTLEVIDEAGTVHPHFELATPEEAQAHMKEKTGE